MEDIKIRFVQLLNQESLTAEEQEWLIRCLRSDQQGELEAILYRYFENDQHAAQSGKMFFGSAAELLDAIHEKGDISPKTVKMGERNYWIKMLVAASIVGVIVVAGYFLVDSLHGKAEADIKKMTAVNERTDVEPGSSKAILELSDGSKIVLDEMGNGMIAKDGGAMVMKTGDKLNYKDGKSRSEKTASNTISTPRGGQYFVELSDGTKVWLNAASSIRFPAFFQATERRVEITGEVFFEVAPITGRGDGAKVPFIVKINKPDGQGGEVSVLGTQFNIMAYPDEAEVQTTLLEGSVKYSNGKSVQKLNPGQQSTYSPVEGIRTTKNVKMEEVISWKNGFFHFEGSDPESVLRRLSRWYNTEVVFHKKINDKFYADIPMNTMLSDALKALELTGVVRFTIEDGKIIVN